VPYGIPHSGRRPRPGYDEYSYFPRPTAAKIPAGLRTTVSFTYPMASLQAWYPSHHLYPIYETYGTKLFSMQVLGIGPMVALDPMVHHTCLSTRHHFTFIQAYTVAGPQPLVNNRPTAGPTAYGPSFSGTRYLFCRPTMRDTAYDIYAGPL